MSIVYKFRYSCLEVLHKKYLIWKFLESFHENTRRGSCFNKIARHVTVLKYDSSRPLSWEFTKIPKQFAKTVILWTAASVISLYLRRYWHIFPIHFPLNYSKSYGFSQVYIINEIYHITLMLLLCFICRLEVMYRLIMKTWYNADWCESLLTAWLLIHSSQVTDWLNCCSLLTDYQSHSS